MSDEDVRWKQRFQHYRKALLNLEAAVSITDMDIIRRAGMIQFFEMSFELSWKLMKDYLEAQGFEEIKSPRAAIKKAFEIGLITSGNDWMQLLEDRNMTAHAYDEQTALKIAVLIKTKYYFILKELYEVMGKN